MAVSLFGPYADKGKGKAASDDELRQLHFQKLKAVCVPLLNTTREPSSPRITAELLHHLSVLRASLLAVPPQLFSPALGNYVFFPLSSLLRPDTLHKSDAILEAAFRALAALVVRWRASAGEGMEERLLHELWIMVALRLGGPLDPNAPRKVERREEKMMEESKEAALEVLIALMEPEAAVEQEVTGSTENDNDDDVLGDRIDWTLDEPSEEPTPRPAKKAPAPPPIPILFHTLTTLLPLSSTPTSHATLQLASLSALRLLIEHYLSPRVKDVAGPSPLLATALPGTVSALTRIVLSRPSAGITAEQARRQPSRAVSAALDILNLALGAALSDEATASLRPVFPSLEALAIAPTPLPAETKSIPPPTGPTQPTLGWLNHTLDSLTLALQPILDTLASHASSQVLTSLSNLASSFLSAAPSLPTPLVTSLLACLLQLSASTWPDVAKLATASLHRLLPLHLGPATSLVQARLAALPRAIKRADKSVASSTAILKASLSLLPSDARIPLNSDRWAIALVRALPFISQVDGSTPDVDHGVGELCEALGAWAARVGRAQELVRVFLGAGSERGTWWILQGIVRGLEGGGKESRKAIREVVERAVALLEADQDLQEEKAADSTDVLDGSGSVDGIVTIVEHSQGLTPLPALSSLRPVSLSKTSSRDNLDPLLLRLVGTSSTSLGASFRLLLLRSLYTLLQPTASAREALAIVAHSTGYASATNLVRANADYALNAIARRLGAARLDPSAPAVLGELVQVGGSEIVGMMGDVLEDVWEVLDDYHGYDGIALDLWGVLQAVVAQMSGEMEEVPKPEKPCPGEADWEQFVQWFKMVQSADATDAGEDTLPESNPQVPFGKAAQPDESEGEDPGFPEPGESGGPPPTPSQALAIQILSKATYFLSYSSPILRARVLGLMSASVALFAPSTDPGRHGHYLPAVHRSWPFVLPRLSSSEDPAVVKAAIVYVAALSTHCGDFMSQRIVDDVWPRLRVLLELPWTSAVHGRYAEHHRLVGSILQALEAIADGVPLKEDAVWDMAVTCRRFLLPGEAHKQALRVYRALQKVNRDAVMVAVLGTMDAGLGKGDMPWLVLEGKEQLSLSVLQELE